MPENIVQQYKVPGDTWKKCYLLRKLSFHTTHNIVKSLKRNKVKLSDVGGGCGRRKKMLS